MDFYRDHDVAIRVADEFRVLLRCRPARGASANPEQLVPASLELEVDPDQLGRVAVVPQTVHNRVKVRRERAIHGHKREDSHFSRHAEHLFDSGAMEVCGKLL